MTVTTVRQIERLAYQAFLDGELDHGFELLRSLPDCSKFKMLVYRLHCAAAVYFDVPIPAEVDALYAD